MPAKTSFTLSDGTTLADLMDLDTREVSLRVLSDAEIYALEMERIFARTWLLLGHESEIPNAGDFVVRDMGADQVLVARDRDGKVYVSLNVCPHRGMRLCTTEAGNAAFHRCIYHGWAFRPNGDFLGSPVEREQMHGTTYSKKQLRLRRARVHLYGGLIFATWNVEGPSFEEYLGEAKWYMDMLFQRSDEGLEVLGPPQRVTIPANWKTAGEQSGLDGFHTITLHRSMMEQGTMGSDDPDSIYAQAPAMYGVDVGSSTAHAFRCMPAETIFRMVMGSGVENMNYEQRLEVLPPPGVTKEMLPQLRRHLSAEQMRLLAECPPQVGGLFPNVSLLFLYAPQPDGSMGSAIAVHSFVPRGPDKLEFMTWFCAEKCASVEMKRSMRAIGTQIIGTSGTIEQDDAETWPHMTRNSKGPIGREETMKYQAFHGERAKPASWPGPGRAYEGFTKDDNQWFWWLKWRDGMLTAPPQARIRRSEIRD